MVNRHTLISLVDITAFISFVFMISTGVLMRYVLPPRSGRFIEILGMNRHEWGDIHFYISFVFLLILSLHLLLHWHFIINLFTGQAKNVLNYRFLLGLFALLAVIALAVAPLVVPIEETGEPAGHQHGRGRY